MDTKVRASGATTQILSCGDGEEVCVLGADSSRLCFLEDQSSQILQSPQKRPLFRSGMLSHPFVKETLVQVARSGKLAYLSDNASLLHAYSLLQKIIS